MIITEYQPKYHQSAVQLMCVLQDLERNFSHDRPPSTEVSEAQLDYLVSLTKSGLGRIYLAVQAGRAVGLIAVFEDGEHGGTQHVYPEFRKFGLITDFVVDESYRGTNVAVRLMRTAEQFCEGLGLQVIKLSVLRANRVARRFYEKSGYVAHDIVYRKEISGAML